MRLVILGGNHKNSQKWIHTISEYFASDFEVVTINYEHWSEPAGVIAFTTELNKLRSIISGDECMVVAKSAGTLLAMQAAAVGILKPVKCIFLGLPITFAAKHMIDLKSLLAAHKAPSLIIQNDRDPMGSFDEIAELVAMVGKDKFAVQSQVGSDHCYEDYPEISSYIYKFMESEG